MKDRTQSIGWLILFLIASGFFGFISAWLLGISDPTSYMITAFILTVIAFALCLTFYFYARRKAEYQSLWMMLCRGCYHDVDHRIDEYGKEMNRLWELKMFASFHSGDISAFERIYKDHMNEINEHKTLVSYMICVIKDLMDATLRVKPPAVFLKNDGNRKCVYRKQREYKLYSNIEQGVKEYYGSQKQMAKIYFEQFLNHTDVLSKPLGFYLYYLMTSIMAESDHPQTEEYYRKAQQCVFDDRSLAYMENLRSRLFIVQKGIGYHTMMDKDRNQNRSGNPAFDSGQGDSLNRSFSLDQPAFRRDRSEPANTGRRHSNDIQREFDEMNASLNNEFSPFEHDNGRMSQNRSNDAMNRNQNVGQQEVSDDLDPTWFARNALDANNDNRGTQAFNQKNPSVSEPASPFPNRQNQTMRGNSSMNMNRNQMNSSNSARPIPISSDPLEDTGFQKKQPFFPEQNNNQPQRRRTSDEPIFNNHRANQDNDPRMNFANRNDRQDPLQNTGFMDTAGSQNDNRRQDFMDTQSMARGQMGGSMNALEDTRSDAFQPTFQRQQSSMPLSDEFAEEGKKSKKKKRSRKKKDHNYDSYDDHNQDPYLEQPQFKPQRSSAPSEDRPYSTYVKHNLMIFFFALVDLAIVAVATSSIVYTSYFERFSSVNSDIVKDIVIQALIVTAIMALVTACIHTGFTIMRKPMRNWSGTLKIILSPILLILAAVIGIICHIPYFIFACIKKGKE